MKGYALAQPEGYYVGVNGDTHVLYRPDGDEVLRFDPAALLEHEVALAALEDHALLLTCGGIREHCRQLLGIASQKVIPSSFMRQCRRSL